MNDAQDEIEGPDAPLAQPSLWHYIAILPTWVAAACLFVMMGMTFLDVILRSVFDNPLEYATELTRIFMAVIVFASLPMVSWKGQHIVVDLMDPLFKGIAARLRDIVIDLISGVALAWTAWRIYGLAERSQKRGLVTEYMGFPEHIVGYFIAVFVAITAIVLILRGLARIVRPTLVPQP